MKVLINQVKQKQIIKKTISFETKYLNEDQLLIKNRLNKNLFSI